MFNSSVLDVAIGLVFVYLLLSLMCTTVNEWIAQAFKMRASTLREGIRRLLSAPPDGTYFIRLIDVKAPALARRLSDKNDKLTQAIGPLDASESDAVTQYAADSKDKPATPPPPGLLEKLVARLNTALTQPDLVRKIDDTKVTAETKAQFQKTLKDKDVLRLNRSMLHEAYPDEIAGLSDVFYDHPLIKAISKPGEHPSYVSSGTFAHVLIDILSKAPAAAASAETTVANIRTSIDNLPDSDVKRSLQALMRTTGDNLDEVQKKLETWFDSSMDRVSGWYKKKAQLITMVVAATITILANADTLQIAQQLMINPTIREKIVKEAGTAQAQDAARIAAGTTLTTQEKADLSSMTGWSREFGVFHEIEAKAQTNPKLTDAQIAQARENQTFPGKELLTAGIFWTWIWQTMPQHLLGWLFTAIAVSLGAPFWFDTLNKFMNIRSTGTAPGEKGQDKSKM